MILRICTIGYPWGVAEAAARCHGGVVLERTPPIREAPDERTPTPRSTVGPAHTLGNRGTIALLRALDPAAVVAGRDSGWEREASRADAPAAAVHDGPPAHSAARALGALAFTTEGQIFLSSAVGRMMPEARADVLRHEQVHAARHPRTDHGVPVVYRTPEDEPSPEQQRVGAHLADVLDRLPELSDEEAVRLRAAVGGTDVVRLVLERRTLVASLQQEARATQSRGMGILMHTGQRAERARQVADLDRTIAARLAELGIADERALFRLIDHEMPAQVLARAKLVALAMLDENEATARTELDRYGDRTCTPDLDGLLQADRELQALYADDQIRRFNDAIRDATNESEIDAMLARTGPGYLEELQQRQQSYERLRLLLAIRFPVLLAAGYRPGMFAAAGMDELSQLVARPITDVLDNIGRVREAIGEDDLKVWHVPHAVGAAMAELGIADQPVMVAAVQAKIREREADVQFLGWVKAALAIGTAILAGVLFTPAVGALVGAAWGAESLIGNISTYRTETAAENVALDPALADISMNEPTLVWIVIDIVGLGLDLGALGAALRPAARGVQASPSLATLGRLHDEAIAAGASPELAEALTRRAAGRFGLNADDVVELAPQTRRAAVSRPDLLAEYEKLANERMARVTRDVLAAQRSTPARQRLQVLRDEFDTFRRSVGERALTDAERGQAMALLREARDLARDDFGTLRQSIWRRLRADPELQRIADQMVAAGDAQLGRRGGSVRVRTEWDDGRRGFQALEPDHRVRLSDNPWRYNDPDNVILTDSAQNQQFLEALRREGGIWATDDVERFVVSHGLIDQTGVGGPGAR